MKSNTDSQEKQRTVISHSTAEFMTPPKKRLISKYLPALLDIPYAQVRFTCVMSTHHTGDSHWFKV